jgi:hypothetical protein
MPMRLLFFFLVAAFFVAGFVTPRCTPAAEPKKDEPKKQEDDTVARFWIYQDAASKVNHGEWTNWMPKGADQMISLNLADRANPAGGESCVRMSVRFMPPNWCGVAVSCLADYWGETPSDSAYDLRRATKLVFDARGDKGRECIMVKVAVAGDKPHGDSARTPAATHWLELENKWKRYELPLNQKRTNLSRVVIPVCIVCARDRNPTDEITFWLDNIHFVLAGGQ